MTWPGFYALSAAWLFTLIAPLVLFYFLKLKRPRMQVPSLMLWGRVLNDQRVNSPFQKFKRNILLLLQLLLLILLVLAAMQPYWRGGLKDADYVPVLIDTSASMAASDEPGGESRLDLAKQRARDMIDGLASNQQLCLISFANSARKLCAFTNNKRLLYQALDKAQIEDVPSRIEEALRMTQALSQSYPFGRVVLLSDGNMPVEADFELAFDLVYERLPVGGQNLGITALSARRASTVGWDVFVRVEGTEQTATTARLLVMQDGQQIANEFVAPKAGEAQRLAVRIDSSEPTKLELQLEVEGFDSLAADNMAWLDLPAARPLAVYVAGSLPGYRQALSGIQGIEYIAEPTAPSAAPDESAVEAGTEAEAEAPAPPQVERTVCDLVMTNDPSDLDRFEARTWLTVGFVPPDLDDLVGVDDQGAAVIDWQRDAPLLQHVLLTDLVILDRPVLGENATEADLEQRGYEVLVHGQHGPLLVQKRHSRSVAFNVLFDTERSTLPYRLGFPILVYNAVQIATHEAALSEVRAGRTGVLQPVKLEPKRTYSVKDPTGASRNIASNDDGVVHGVPAPQVGRYTLYDGLSAKAEAGASLLNAGETTLGSVERIQFSELEVAAQAGAAQIDRTLWGLLASIALVVLAVEWWFFQHRPRGA